jgi:Asparagine synthase.
LYESQKERGIKVSIDGHGADEFLYYRDWILQISVTLLNNIVNLYKTSLKFGNTNSIKQFKQIFGLHNKLSSKIDFKNNLFLNNYFTNYFKNNEFENSFQYINEDLDDLKNFSYDQNFSYLMSYCGWFQFFSNKWDRASMSKSVEVRMPFLDNNVRLFNLALFSNMKIRDGNTKSVLRDAFKNEFPR